MHPSARDPHRPDTLPCWTTLEEEPDRLVAGISILLEEGHLEKPSDRQCARGIGEFRADIAPRPDQYPTCWSRATNTRFPHEDARRN